MPAGLYFVNAATLFVLVLFGLATSSDLGYTFYNAFWWNWQTAMRWAGLSAGWVSVFAAFALVLAYPFVRALRPRLWILAQSLAPRSSS